MPETHGGLGTVWIWGDNIWSQQCDGTTDPRLVPEQIESLSNVETVVGGGGHGAVLLTDRTVWGWGRNDAGQAGDGTYENRSVPAPIEGLENIKSLVGGGGHTVALAEDDTVWAWGHNGRGDCGDGTSDNRPSPVKVKNLTEVASLSWGGGHGVALRGDGTVWAWGHNIVGGCGDGTSITRLEPVQVHNLSNVVEVAGGGSHTMALTESGELWAWGRNDRGQIGDGTNETRFEPVRVAGLDDIEIKTFTCGYFHTMLLDADGNVWAWGNNDMGQLGIGGDENTNVPVKVTTVGGVQAIAGGGGRNEWGPGGHSLAILADGTAVGWGLNDAGQLGDGTTDNREDPVEVKGLVNVQQVVACGGYSIALL